MIMEFFMTRDTNSQKIKFISVSSIKVPMMYFKRASFFLIRRLSTYFTIIFSILLIQCVATFPVWVVFAPLVRKRSFKVLDSFRTLVRTFKGAIFALSFVEIKARKIKSLMTIKTLKGVLMPPTALRLL